MNSIQKGLLTLMLGGIAAGAFVGCDEDDTFDINSPSWLEDRIDSIAASKDKGDRGDTTSVVITKSEVGAEDCSSGWFTEFSQFFAIPSGQQLTVRFTNYTSGANNWNNWNIVVANAAATSVDQVATYAEYFALRSDAYGWGGTLSTYDDANISTNYAEVAAAAGATDQWAYFLSHMQGAEVELKLQHVSAGYCYVTATATATDGTVFIEEYHQECSASDDIYVYLVADGSHFKINDAFLTPAEIVISESNPARLDLSGYPAFLTLGDSAYTAGLQAKVYYEDGTSAELDSADMSYIAPDLASTGTKTVTVVYNKTSRGNYCSPIYASYQLLITDFKALGAVIAERNYYFAAGETSTPFATSSAKVYGIGSAGDSTLLSNADVTFSDVAADGSYTISYQGLKYTGKASVKAIPEAYKTNVSYDGLVLGAEDNTAGWWTVFSKDTQVKVSETAVATFTNYTNGVSNWNNFVVILRSEDKATEYSVLRADNYGWGTGYSTATLESDAAADWDTWRAAMNGAKVTVEITNNVTTADVVVTMVGNNGVTYVQKYLGVTIDDPDNLYFAFTLEASHLVFE